MKNGKQTKPAPDVKPLPPPPVRVEVLRTAEKYVSADRNATHGEPEDSFGMIAALWDTYLAQTGRLAYGERITRADVALLMSLQKTARAAVNPEHKDSWIDIAGYAACGYECALVDKAGKDIVEVRDQDGRKIRIS